MEPPHHQACLNWRRVAPLLSSDAAAAGKKAGSASGKKLRMRVLDTVFLSDGRSSASNGSTTRGSNCSRRQPLNRRTHPYGPSSSSSSQQPTTTIGEWIYTSKKGEVTLKRGDSLNGPSTSSSSSSLWSHVCDRFGRITLSDAANAAGPRIVAIGRGRGGDGGGDSGGGFDVRCHLTAEQLRRDVCGSSASASGGGGRGGSLISANRCHAIQTYVRPKGGVDRIFRAIYTSDGSGGGDKNLNPNVDVVMVEDGSTVGASCASVVPLDESTLGRQQGGEQYLRQVKKEVQMTTVHAVRHVESVLNTLHSDGHNRRARVEVKEKAPRVISVAMDFIWDDNDHLWLSHSNGMRISRGEEDQDECDGAVNSDGGIENNGASSSSLGPLLENYSERTPIVDGGGDVAAGGGPPLLHVQRPVPMASSSVAEMEFIERNGLGDLILESNNDAQHTKELLAVAEQEKHEAQEEARHLQQQVNELEDELEGIRSRLDATSQTALDANDKIQ